jgi:hypothetical protein
MSGFILLAIGNRHISSRKSSHTRGINTRFQARLNAYGIFTPTEFYNAPLDLLKKQVFQSILGY